MQQAIQAKQKRRAGRMEIKADDIAEEIRRVAFADIRDVLSVGDNGKVSIADSDEWTREQAAAVGEVARRSTASSSRCTTSSTPSTSSRGSSGCMTTG